MKIIVQVITEMEFINEGEFDHYLKSDSPAQITGFAAEIREAWDSKKSLSVATPRPEYGVVTRSEIVVKGIEE